MDFRLGLALGAFRFDVRGLSGGRAFGGGAQFRVIFDYLADGLQARPRLIHLAVNLLEAEESEGGAHGGDYIVETLHCNVSTAWAR